MKLLHTKKILFSLSFFMLPMTVSAAILDLGIITRDTETGLDWLDVTETSGLSVNEVLAEMGSGGDYAGWRYATVTEVDQLITNFGFIPKTPCPTNNIVNCTSPDEPGDNPIIETMIRTLGDSYAKIKPEYDYSMGAGQTIGYVQNDVSPFGAYNLGIIGDFEYIDHCQAAGCPRNIDGDDYIILNGGSSVTYKGSFLVSASPVPVPAAGWLLGSGILGLIGLARRKAA